MRRTWTTSPALERHRVSDAYDRLNIAKAIEAVKEYTYKPDTEFEVYPEPHNRLRVRMQMRVQNSRRQHWVDYVKLDVAQTITVDAALNPKTLQQFMRNFVHSAEQHEADEWLRHNGRLVHDPHA